jgi:hypothetical protein
MRDEKKTRPYSGKQIDSDERKGKTSAYDKRSSAVSKQESMGKRKDTQMVKKDKSAHNPHKGKR